MRALRTPIGARAVVVHRPQVLGAAELKEGPPCGRKSSRTGSSELKPTGDPASVHQASLNSLSSKDSTYQVARGKGSRPRAGAGLVLSRCCPWWRAAQAKPNGHKGLRAAASRNKPRHMTSNNSRNFIFSPFRSPPFVPVLPPPQCAQYVVPNPWTME